MKYASLRILRVQDTLAIASTASASIDIPVSRKIAVLADASASGLVVPAFQEIAFRCGSFGNPEGRSALDDRGLGARVPRRFHTFTGQVWATRKGLSRGLLRLLDRVIFSCASEVLVDSPSQRDFLLAEGVVDQRHSTVLAEGSISGVDLGRFHADAPARVRIRHDLGIPEEAFVFLFLGRSECRKGDSRVGRSVRLADSQTRRCVSPSGGTRRGEDVRSSPARHRIPSEGASSTATSRPYAGTDTWLPQMFSASRAIAKALDRSSSKRLRLEFPRLDRGSTGSPMPLEKA